MSINHTKPMTIAAHRGDSYNHFENTMTAFEAGIKNGATMIETDVHLSADNVVVIMHDNTVDRTTDGKGNISDMTVEELLKLNAGNKIAPEKIPLFEVFIKWVAEKQVLLNIEFKEYYSEENAERCAKCIEDVLALVEKYNLKDNVVFNSFDAWVLEYIYKKHGKKYMLHGFYPYSIMKNVTINPDEYLYCACIFDDKNKSLYDYLIEKNIEPWVGAGVTQIDRLALCLEYGAKLVTTNNPADTIRKLKG